MKKVYEYGILLNAICAVYLIFLGIWSNHPGTSAPFSWVGLWHPVMMACFGFITMFIACIIEIDRVACSACMKLNVKLHETEKALQDLKL